MNTQGLTLVSSQRKGKFRKAIGWLIEGVKSEKRSRQKLGRWGQGENQPWAANPGLAPPTGSSCSPGSLAASQTLDCTCESREWIGSAHFSSHPGCPRIPLRQSTLAFGFKVIQGRIILLCGSQNSAPHPGTFHQCSLITHTGFYSREANWSWDKKV